MCAVGVERFAISKQCEFDLTFACLPLSSETWGCILEKLFGRLAIKKKKIQVAR